MKMNSELMYRSGNGIKGTVLLLLSVNEGSRELCSSVRFCK